MDSHLLELLVNTDIDFNAITKKGILLKAVQAKIDNPKETKQNIANNLNVSTRTLQRYANEYNFNDFKKQKNKTTFNPVKCDHCEFISKSISGVKSHERAKHLDKIVDKNYTIKDQKETRLSENVSNLHKKRSSNLRKNKEETGFGEEEQPFTRRKIREKNKNKGCDDKKNTNEKTIEEIIGYDLNKNEEQTQETKRNEELPDEEFNEILTRSNDFNH